jgi:hypothetical protein
MSDARDPLQTIRELHALGATSVRVGDIEVRFERVFRPLQPVTAELPVRDAEELDRLRVENETLRELRASVERLGLV